MRKLIFAIAMLIPSAAFAGQGSWHMIFWNSDTTDGFHEASISDDGMASQAECLIGMGRVQQYASAHGAKDRPPMTCVYVPPPR